VALAALGGFFADGFVGSRIERTGFPCNCDDPGLRGFTIGAPAGAVSAGVIAFRLTR